MNTRAPSVAVVGRQNVGKSTLVNRLVGRREAIAHETAGVTRDRLELPVEWRGKRFVVFDTGGLMTKPRGIDAVVVQHAMRAAELADVVLLVVDASVGLTADDESLARLLQRSPRPVLVVANKVDSSEQEPLAAEFHALGLGEPVPVSALHGRGTGDLLDLMVAVIPEVEEAPPEEEARVAIVGRPNVGKSSLFNRLVREERVVVHSEPGTTRDAVDSVVEVDGRAIRFVDTAGFRRQGRTEGVEYYGLVRSLKALDAAHIALLVVDATEGFTGEDKRVAARAVEAGRGLVGVLNKWDLVPSGERTGTFQELSRQVQLFPATPVVKTSALTGSGVGRVVPALLGVHEAWARHIPTAEVNRVLHQAVAAHPPPGRTGMIRYGTQVRTGPPTFVLFGSGDPGPTYRRYLEGVFREDFGLAGTPVRLLFRGRRPGRGGGSKRRRSGGR